MPQSISSPCLPDNTQEKNKTSFMICLAERPKKAMLSSCKYVLLYLLVWVFFLLCFCFLVVGYIQYCIFCIGQIGKKGRASLYARYYERYTHVFYNSVIVAISRKNCFLYTLFFFVEFGFVFDCSKPTQLQHSAQYRLCRKLTTSILCK